MMWWFGESWGAPVCEPEKHIPDSEGPWNWSCMGCSLPVLRGTQGFVVPDVAQLYLGPAPGCELMSPRCPHWYAWHLECFLRECGVVAPRDSP